MERSPPHDPIPPYDPMPVLGRSVVVDPGADPPAAWMGVERVPIDGLLLGDPVRLAGTVEHLHRAWVGRRPMVIELGIGDRVLAEPEQATVPAYQLGEDFTFLRERLHFLVWANSYDARRSMWWWAVKARPAGAEPGGPADVTLPDGQAAYIDGGPREPVDLTDRVIHAETIGLGRLEPIPRFRAPTELLAPDQMAAVTHRAGAARVIAPAGSGKTRVLVSRLRHLLEERQFEEGTICALAYNQRAAAEMRGRLGRRVEVRTIHSLGWEILRAARGPLTLLDERQTRRRLEPLVKTPPRPNTDLIAPYLEALGEVRIALRSPEDVEASRDDVPGFAEVYPRYRRALTEHREADHDEQVFGSVEALLADPVLRRGWQGRCRHLLVDEFQDITPTYLLLIRLLASPGLEVFGVGDDDQVIYGYAGADPRFLIEFESLFPGATGYALEVNYRCPSPVVEAATRLLSHNRERVEKSIRPGPAAVEAPESMAVQAHPESELGRAALRVIEAWLDEGVAPASIVVLARVNSALLPVQAALAKAEQGFVSPLEPRLLERTVIRAALAWIRIALSPNEIARDDIFQAIRRPSRGLTRLAINLLGRRQTTSLAELERLGRSLDGQQLMRWTSFLDDIAVAATSTSSTVEAMKMLVDEIGLSRAAAALDAGRSRADRAAQGDDLRALLRTAHLHPDLVGFEPWLRGCLGSPTDPGGVTLTTIHRVKGLEWDRVLVFGVDRDTLPHVLSQDVEEERRVLHVAITRGRERVVVMSDRERISPFVHQLLGELEPAGSMVTERRGERPSHRLKDAVAEPTGTADPGLVEHLRRWRADTARAQGIPAYLVFHDTTIEELAIRRPVTERDLLKITGIGPVKLEAYGDDLIAILSG